MKSPKAEPKPKKEKKPPLGRRLGEKMRSAGEVGAESVRNPRGIPGQAHGAFRSWFRNVWNTRGGSVYTLGYALSFAALELKTVMTGLAGMTSAGEYVMGQVWQFLLRFSADSIANLVLALMWPVYVLSWRPPSGVVLFVLAFLLFPKFIKPHVERWLFGDGEQPPPKPEEEQSRN